jgi:hypothetical protein
MKQFSKLAIAAMFLGTALATTQAVHSATRAGAADLALSEPCVTPLTNQIERRIVKNKSIGSLDALYRKSIADAAVNRTKFCLKPILTSTVAVATFQRHAPIDLATNTLTDDTWVSLVPDVQEKCRKRRGDSAVRVEQILGLPPQSDQNGRRMMFRFTVQASDVFRPCASGSSTKGLTCERNRSTIFDSDTAFVFDKLWTSHVDNMRGYPFTGMGWTYDWSPQAAPSHFGVSEYVVRKGAHVTDVHQAITARALCSPRSEAQ